MDAKTKLKRFCFLGSFDPVYIHLRRSVNVELYWPIVNSLFKGLDDTIFLPLMREVLHDVPLVRRDESLFLYAAYFASEVDVKWKTAMRIAFPILLRTDEDLFLFCKYVGLIGVQKKQKCFSRTVRKALKSWYETQSPTDIHTMWMSHRGLHGFTHKALIKLCHISDATMGASDVASPFFLTCTILMKEVEAKKSLDNSNMVGVQETVKKISGAPVVPTTDPNADAAQVKTESSSNVQPQQSADDSAKANTTKKKAKVQKNVLPPLTAATIQKQAKRSALTEAISILRTTKKRSEAIRIVRKYKMTYTQVPGHWQGEAVIMQICLHSMPYLHILRNWRKMVRNNHFKSNANLFKICKKKLENKDFAKQCRVHPIHLLMFLRDIGNLEKLPNKTAEALKLEYLTKLYMDSFNWHPNSGNLRMHITVNLQSNYKKKFLKNHKKLNYYDACLALAFGYSKREAKVDIFHWYEDKTKLKKIMFEKHFTTEKGFKSYDVVENHKNSQRLVTPIMNALCSEQVYDVFLCIVPTAGRGNPGQNSDFLCSFLDRYRENKNPNARFIILNLLKYKRSMKYSDSRAENILEICGLDEHTTDLIHNFATHRFS